MLHRIGLPVQYLENGVLAIAPKRISKRRLPSRRSVASRPAASPAMRWSTYNLPRRAESPPPMPAAGLRRDLDREVRGIALAHPTTLAIGSVESGSPPR